MSEPNPDRLSVSFELSETDVAFFRRRLESAHNASAARDEASVIDSAEQLVADAIAAEPPEFVRERIDKLAPFIAMLRDEEWRLEGDDRTRVLDALAYFVEPDDLIPDRIPGIGYLDDAIMIELVVRELQPELEAFEEFIAYRDNRPAGEEAAQLEAQREELQSRMRRRARRSRGGGGLGSGRSPFRLF